jgi:glycosyltransferase involved in cell wall biosynthesis
VSRTLILHCFDGLGIGGAESQLLLLLRHIPRRTMDHAVCHLGVERDLAPEILALGVPVFDLSDGGTLGLPRSLLRVVRLIRRVRPNVIHADHGYGKLVARLAGVATGVPVLATVGGMKPAAGRRGGFWSRRGQIVRLLEWFDRGLSDRMTARYLAVSEAVKHSLVREGVRPDRISVVRRGVDLDLFSPDPPERLSDLRRALGLSGLGPVLLHVGRLATPKGQETIIRALLTLRRAHPRMRLLLAGDGPNREAYRRLAELEGVGENVQFLGIRRDVRQLLQIADVFVFPSHREGAGGALLEALAMGRPTVASRIPAHEEIAGREEAVVLVPPRRPELLAEALIGLLADPRRRDEMGRRGREIVERRFDIRRNALDFARVCASVSEAKHPRSPAAEEVA